MKTHKIIAQQGIARTFQNIRLFGDMTVIDNVRTAFTKDIKYNLFDVMLPNAEVFLASSRIPGRKGRWSALRSSTWTTRLTIKAKSLPYGQQRKLEIARALATDMKLAFA